MTDRRAKRPRATPPELSRLAYGVAELSRLVGISRSTIHAKIADGTLPSRKVLGRRLISAETVRAMLGEGGNG